MDRRRRKGWERAVPDRPVRARGGGRSGGREGGRRRDRGGGRAERPRSRKPVIPEDVPRLPRGVWRDIDAATAHGLAPEVARAVSAASELADAEPERATALLSWAKDVAPRSASVREALGVDAYRRGDFDTAARELGAYRRMSGRQDQNHLLADSLRATGRGDRVRELVQAMGDDVDEERRLEGQMVHAGALADAGDALRAREVLERAGGEPAVAGPPHLRVWYMAAELSLDLGDTERAAELLEAVVTVDPEFLDAADRLAELRGDDEDDGAAPEAPPPGSR